MSDLYYWDTTQNKRIPVSTENPLPVTGGGGGGGTVNWEDVQDKPVSFPTSTTEISDASVFGRSISKATDAAAARALIGGAAATHTHNATDISAGILDVARIPTLAQAKVTSLSTDLAARIQKAVLAAINPIADPETATAVDIATAFNSLLAALKG